MAERVRELVRQTCEAFEIWIVRGVVSKDHVHIVGECAAEFGAERDHAADQGALVELPVRGIPAHQEKLLGPAFLGARILLRDGWTHD